MEEAADLPTFSEVGIRRGPSAPIVLARRERPNSSMIAVTTTPHTNEMARAWDTWWTPPVPKHKLWASVIEGHRVDQASCRVGRTGRLTTRWLASSSPFAKASAKRFVVATAKNVKTYC